ncbi:MULTISPECIES: polyprenyl diphosphate synthase [Kitasatospora]|uniref:Isoprenyl transferase n=1 Tax=Kitasatospora setae (strain ATCC 33774 / DSM 43861 / JCM 3304 / KCC A-0304 / NBRC 14216 / KM-6054) TaxID=452652 RepID=E4NJG6_KITSK|nr:MULTISPECIES: polyprenyl diphosphate synthase [Kitasatospora]BAJ33114.1 putative undecaprenyl diphosphate synthase [Kitasatospora setae KM-6054]
MPVPKALHAVGSALDSLLGPLRTGRLRRRLAGAELPRHIGLIMDGNRRWARERGLADTRLGHRHGARHAGAVLGWCEALGVRHVTVFVCSAENLERRGDAEVAFLMRVIEDVLARELAGPRPRWRVHLAGDPATLPDSTVRALRRAVDATAHCATGAHLTLAVGYGGRQELVHAVRGLLNAHADTGRPVRALAEELTADHIARHLHTAGHPDPDLVIRTSGEQRMSNFLLWQSAYAELYFADAHWPAFRELDFLRAVASYAARGRRYGR